MSEIQTEAPAAGEEIHLPGPSAIPVLNAVGITLVVIGTTIWWVLILVGLLIFAGTTLKWIRDTRADVANLPEEHHH